MVISVISSLRMKMILSETLIEIVVAVPTPILSSAGLDSLKISVLEYGFWMELILAGIPRPQEYLEVLYRMVTVGLSSGTVRSCSFYWLVG
jgi:hypothetical protein